jgi:DNA-binding response OmpR family regulator
MPSVLLIEDDVRIARLLNLELDDADWTVQWQRSGRDGVHAVTGSSFDIVLLDLMLPDIDGILVCQIIRRETDVPLLMLTARDGVTDRVKGLDAGADDYLVKPFAMAELLARMRALTRRHKPQVQEEWLVVGQLRLSERRHEVRIGAHPVDLTGREFALLQYLMHNAAIVVTRDMILEHVWGWGYRGSTTVVDVYVGYLRHKLDWNRAEVTLDTVRGVGYLLKDKGAS